MKWVFVCFAKRFAKLFSKKEEPLQIKMLGNPREAELIQQNLRDVNEAIRKQEELEKKL